MKKVAFYTLGCKVNQVETEQIKEDFINQGYSIVDFDGQADIYIINTCTVTHVSNRKSRSIIRRAVKGNPRALVVVTGCMAQTETEQIKAIEGVSLIVGNREKENVLKIAEEFIQTKGSLAIIADKISRTQPLKPVIYQQPHDRTRAFVKIQDGCENFCSYCIVPFARGPVRSKLPQDVVQEVQQLVGLGYKEIILTGIHIGSYGVDLGNYNIVKILETILNQVSGEYRIRLSSIEPTEFSPALVSLAAEENKICPHFHIPLQSGSNRILREMNRSYTQRFYQDLVDGIASKIPDSAITTDVMVGFPTEEEEDFRHTYRLIEKLPVFDLHVFKYSSRPGTKAATMSGMVPEEDKKIRSRKLLELAEQKRLRYMNFFLNKELKILVEEKIGNTAYKGLSDNYIQVVFNHGKDLRGQLVKAQILEIKDNQAIGQLAAD
ncbi:MAG: tRNA (N(6)-L-threonylcarbamoyladenosine(37)-C(2))-methylthiotransferase MtaB [Syntrophomonadaceae bacterium]